MHKDCLHRSEIVGWFSKLNQAAGARRLPGDFYGAIRAAECSLVALLDMMEEQEWQSFSLSPEPIPLNTLEVKEKLEQLCRGHYPVADSEDGTAGFDKGCTSVVPGVGGP